MTLTDHAETHGWAEDQTFIGARGTWSIVRRGEVTVESWRSRWRHYRGRAYRGNALMAIFRSQREIVEFLATAT